MTGGAPLAVRAAPALAPLDLAAGLVFGTGPPRRAVPAPLPSTRATPLDALERAVRPALSHPPCLVSFSGGRDSSLVLAAATRVARREGLTLPIPATNRFAGAPDADESEWQQEVVTALGLQDWLRLEFTDELDAVGLYARRLLRSHGLLWPFNVHFHLPLLDAARGGSLITGVGGDELFAAAQRRRVEAVLARVTRPTPRDVARVAFAFAPAGVRKRAIARREPVTYPWLRPQARRVLSDSAAAEAAAEPRALAARMAYWRALRYLRVSTACLGVVGADCDVRISHPLYSAELWAAVARAGAPLGFASRTAGMRALFDRLLPDALLARTGKACFDEVFWHDHSRTFAAAWDGTGVPGDLVDIAALREHWRAARPAPQSFTLLQAAWLEAHAN